MSTQPDADMEPDPFDVIQKLHAHAMKTEWGERCWCERGVYPAIEDCSDECKELGAATVEAEKLLDTMLAPPRKEG